MHAGWSEGADADAGKFIMNRGCARRVRAPDTERNLGQMVVHQAGHQVRPGPHGHAVTMNKPTQGAEDDDAGCAHPLHGGAGRGR